MLYDLSLFLNLFIKDESDEDMKHLYILRHLESPDNTEWVGKINSTNKLLKELSTTFKSKISSVDKKVTKTDMKVTKLE